MSEEQARYKASEHPIPSGACRRCKRPLTDPKSVEAGLGPVCAGMNGAPAGPEEYEAAGMVHVEVPIHMGFFVKRLRDGRVSTSVPWRVVSHSPTGFAWGYSGSGPADLALNIVEAALIELGFKGRRTKCPRGYAFEFALEIHQEFKERHVAPLPEAGGTIPWIIVREYVIHKIARRQQLNG